MKVETVRLGENAMSFCPERGGIITSIVIMGREILYLDQETFENQAVNVKGGVPIMFPNAGALPEGIEIPAEFKALKQHGFARQSSRWYACAHEAGFYEELVSSLETRLVYPFLFKLSLYGQLETDGTCRIDQKIYNPEVFRSLPVSVGLHPYFRIPPGTKRNIEFQFPGGDVVKAGVDCWANGKAVSITNPGKMRVHVPGWGNLNLNSSPEYGRIWVWSLPEKDFICIEPVMKDKGAIVTDPFRIAPNKTCLLRFKIGFEPD